MIPRLSGRIQGGVCVGFAVLESVCLHPSRERQVCTASSSVMDTAGELTSRSDIRWMYGPDGMDRESGQRAREPKWRAWRRVVRESPRPVASGSPFQVRIQNPGTLRPAVLLLIGYSVREVWSGLVWIGCCPVSSRAQSASQFCLSGQEQKPYVASLCVQVEYGYREGSERSARPTCTISTPRVLTMLPAPDVHGLHTMYRHGWLYHP